MALTTVLLGYLTPADSHVNYVALDPANRNTTAEAGYAILTGRTLNGKYIDGLLTTTQKTYLYAQLALGNTAINLVTMP